MNEANDALALWNVFLTAPPADRAEVLAQISDEQLGEIVLAMGLVARRDALARLPRDEQARLLARLSENTLVELGKQGVAALGTYRARLTKKERVRGSMAAPQTIALTLRSEPFAFRLVFESGPSAGRRALYSSELRRDEIRIKEAGVLGLAGALWLNLDNAMTRIDTNHRATEIGFASLLQLIEGDLKKARAAGARHSRKDEGFDQTGAYGCVFGAPPGVPGLYAVSTRILFDVASSLPVGVDVHDAQGLLESYRYAAVERTEVPADFFTLRAASL